MNIITIFISNINKYGIKFLSFIFIYELINIYRFRISDYFVVNPVNKKNEPCVPTPYYFLKLIEKRLFTEKFTFMDFGCGKGRVLDYIKKNKNIKKIVGIENNIKLKHNLFSLKNQKFEFYFKDCSSSNFISSLSKKYRNQNLVLYFYHPFSEKLFNKILKIFLRTNNKKVRIIVLGKIFASNKLKNNFELKINSLHKFFNIYDYKNR